MVSPATDAPAALPEDAVARFLGGLWQLNRRLKQLAEPVLAEAGELDLQRFILLRAVERGVVYPKDLSAHLGIIPTQLSRLLESLVARGWLERQLDPEDSRRIRLSLTPTGAALTQQASQAIQQVISAHLQGMGAERLSALLAAIDVLAMTDSLPSPITPPRPESE
ncbi:MarR family winged helix-turn-helix transcriptional regulator [Deinococcus sp. HMF7604]|uniref:MarR family winged helix-turn-helix transcriptional regulator n=1 Tax=Deinococcus betulae TaxID=2873312 RepID=UPI001CCC6240|nr:MarR family winged helix-turn-helix transcriptional regulator [Deinococcus betulae]